MLRRSWFIALISLAVLLSLLASGCQGSKPGYVMVECKDNEIMRAYKEAFNSGGGEGYREAITGEYSPSLKKVWLGGFKRSVSYWKGFQEGYDYGWKMYEKYLPGPPGGDYWTSAYNEYKKGGEQAVTGYVYVTDEGYASGYNNGMKQALADSKAGRGFNGDPADRTVNDICGSESQNYREGWIAGYKDGYREHYNIEAYDRGYEAGEKQAMSDSKEGRAYNGDPSDSAVEAGCSGKSQDYREIWVAGYKAGYEDNWWNNQVEGSSYQAGFEEGYKAGLGDGASDKKCGFPFNDKPYTHSAMNEEYERGIEDGYAKGYKEGYEKGQP